MAHVHSSSDEIRSEEKNEIVQILKQTCTPGMCRFRTKSESKLPDGELNCVMDPEFEKLYSAWIDQLIVELNKRKPESIQRTRQRNALRMMMRPPVISSCVMRHLCIYVQLNVGLLLQEKRMREYRRLAKVSHVAIGSSAKRFGVFREARAMQVKYGIDKFSFNEPYDGIDSASDRVSMGLDAINEMYLAQLQDETQQIIGVLRPTLLKLANVVAISEAGPKGGGPQWEEVSLLLCALHTVIAMEEPDTHALSKYSVDTLKKEHSRKTIKSDAEKDTSERERDSKTFNAIVPNFGQRVLTENAAELVKDAHPRTIPVSKKCLQFIELCYIGRLIDAGILKIDLAKLSSELATATYTDYVLRQHANETHG